MQDLEEFVRAAEPTRVYQTLIDILWDSASTSIPPNEHVNRWIELLRARDDADNPTISSAIAECVQYVAI